MTAGIGLVFLAALALMAIAMIVFAVIYFADRRKRDEQ
jgi:cbb3-type cytochrome oxidase subunit 3